VRRVSLHRLRPFALAISVALGVVVADVLTKWWAGVALASGDRHVVGPLWLRLTSNPGLGFSIGRSIPVVVAIAEAAALVFVVVMARRTRPGAPAIGFGLLIGGGVANLAGRLVSSTGTVRDFVAVGSFPVFNLADAAVTCGVAILVFHALLQRPLLVNR
jgi:signal peptidase II